MRAICEVVSEAVVRELRQLETRGYPARRRSLIRTLMQQAVAQIVAEHPVDTGRAVSAWINGSSSGITGQSEGIQNAHETATTSAIELENQVPYIVFLEYGTQRMAPFAMVRQALGHVRGTVDNVWRTTETAGS